MKQSYFGIVTSTVLFSKQLKDREKILYAHISVLQEKTGWCFASNEYFAEATNCSIPTINRSIKLLKEIGFVEVVTTPSSKGIQRKIRIVTDPMITSEPRITSDQTPMITSEPHNITSINNTSKKKKNKEKFSLNKISEAEELLIDNYCSSEKNHWADYSDFYKEELLKSLVAGNKFYRVVLEILHGENEVCS